MICDFCSAPEPLHEIQVRSFQIEDLIVSDGNFMACGICMTFIDAGNQEGLLGYSLRTLAMKHPELLVDGQLHALSVTEVRHMQELFWKNRIR